MTFSDYERGVLRTWDGTRCGQDQVCNAAMGLSGETGEAVDLLKKGLFHGVDTSPEKVQRELGDVLYYVTILASLHGFTLEQVAAANNAKLAARYPGGFMAGGGDRSGEGA